MLAGRRGVGQGMTLAAQPGDVGRPQQRSVRGRGEVQLMAGQAGDVAAGVQGECGGRLVGPAAGDRHAHRMRTFSRLADVARAVALDAHLTGVVGGAATARMATMSR